MDKNLYVVVVDSCYVRDMQVRIEPFKDNEENDEDCWRDWDETDLYVGIYEAKDEEEARQTAADSTYYLKDSLRAYEVK